MTELARIRWRCRRGMLELDALFAAFLKAGYAQLDAAGRQLFVRLLEEADADLWEWLSGRQNDMPQEYQPIVTEILALATRGAVLRL